MAGRFHDGEIWPNRPALLVPRGECILCMLGKDCPPDISHHPHQWIFFWHFVIYDFVQSRFCLRVLDHDNKTKHEVKIGQRSRREAMFQVTYSLPPGYYRIISRLILCCFQVTSILLPFYFQVTSWLHPYTNFLVTSRLPKKPAGNVWQTNKEFGNWSVLVVFLKNNAKISFVQIHHFLKNLAYLFLKNDLLRPIKSR